MRKFFTIDQAEDAAGGAGGGEGSQGGDGAISQAAAVALAAQESDKKEAAAQPAGEPGKTSQEAAAEQFELTHNGNKIKMTRQEVIDAAQRGYNTTQKEQEISKLKKELIAKHARANQIIEEAEKAGKQPEGEEEPESELNQLKNTITGITEKLQLQEWEKALGPIHTKFPDVDELELAAKFQEKVKAGEVENTNAGLEEVATELAQHSEGKVNKKLEAVLADEKNNMVTSHNQKVIEKFLANPEDPKLKAYEQKVIADYVAGKTKLSSAGGDNGKGAAAGAGAGKDKVESISDVAERHRQTD